VTNERRVLVHADKTALTGSVAARFITKVVDLLDEQPTVHAVLSSINESPARDSIDWSRVHLWWGDERWLPYGDRERNDQQAREALIDHLSIPEANVHYVPTSDGELDLDAAAASYASELASAADDGADYPRFDITFLGVGPDGHVASLFPDR
jgi:6-phosphogluconolactonase